MQFLHIPHSHLAVVKHGPGVHNPQTYQTHFPHKAALPMQTLPTRQWEVTIQARKFGALGLSEPINIRVWADAPYLARKQGIVELVDRYIYTYERGENMNKQAKIALWEQRLLRGKLHLPQYITPIETEHGKINSGIPTPICGRMLNNHTPERAQLSDQIEYSTSHGEFVWQLMNRKACRHCAVKAGLLVRTVTIQEEESEDE